MAGLQDRQESRITFRCGNPQHDCVLLVGLENKQDGGISSISVNPWDNVDSWSTCRDGISQGLPVGYIDSRVEKLQECLWCPSCGLAIGKRIPIK